LACEDSLRVIKVVKKAAWVEEEEENFFGLIFNFLAKSLKSKSSRVTRGSRNDVSSVIIKESSHSI
jgi:hypothetical protein